MVEIQRVRQFVYLAFYSSTSKKCDRRKYRMDLPMKSLHPGMVCNITMSNIILYNNYKVF
jgi:hypothetical protein